MDSLREHVFKGLSDQKIAAALAKKTFVSRDYCSYNLGDRGAEALALELAYNTHITELCLDTSNIGDVGAEALANALKKNTRSNRIGHVGAEALSNALCSKRSINYFDLRGNSIGDQGAEAFAQLLKHDTLTFLGLSNTQSQGVEVLATALAVTKRLTTFHLTGCSFGFQGAQAFATFFEVNSTLTKLDLSHTKFDGDGIRAFAKGLGLNSGVTFLDLNDCNLGVQGAKLLTESLAVNTTLTDLSVSGNNFGVEGAGAFTSILATNTTLAKLSTSRNDCDALSRLFSHFLAVRNDQACGFSLCGMGNMTDHMPVLTSLLPHLYFVSHLSLKGNGIDDHAVEQLSTFLSTNTSLDTLDVSDNSISDQGAESLANMLAANTALISVDVKGNNIGDQGAENLGKVLAMNVALNNLNLSDNCCAPLASFIGKFLSVRLQKSVELDLSGLGLSDKNMCVVAMLLPQLFWLKRLILDGNEITNAGAQYISDWLKACPTLPEVSLQDTKLEGVMRSLAAKGSTGLRDFWHIDGQAQQAQEVQRTMRVLVVGLGEVGKTSLIAAIRSPQLVAPPVGIDERTVGIDIDTCSFPRLKNVKLEVCDFAGQRVYYPTHTFFLSSSALFVLVWRVLRQLSSSDVDAGGAQCAVCGKRARVPDDVLYRVGGVGVCHAGCVAYDSLVRDWVVQLQHRAPGARVVVVAAQCDHTTPLDAQRQCDAVQKHIQAVLEHSRHSNNLAGRSDILPLRVFNDGRSIQTSARTGAGMRDLIAAITTSAVSVLDSTLKLPSVFWKLKARLDESGTAVVQMSTVQTYARELGLREDQLLLGLQVFHDVGFVLRFKQLPEVVIVDPTWVVSLFKSLVCHDHAGLHSTLSDEQATDLRALVHKGILRRSLFNVLWPDDDHDLVVELLKQLELASPFGDGTFFVPVLLTGRRSPTDFSAYRNLETLPAHCRLVFSALPIGFFARLVVHLCQNVSERFVFSQRCATFFVRGKQLTVAHTTIDAAEQVYADTQRGSVPHEARYPLVHVVVAASHAQLLSRGWEAVLEVQQSFQGLVLLEVLYPCPQCRPKDAAPTRPAGSRDWPWLLCAQRARVSCALPPLPLSLECGRGHQVTKEDLFPPETPAVLVILDPDYTSTDGQFDVRAHLRDSAPPQSLLFASDLPLADVSAVALQCSVCLLCFSADMLRSSDILRCLEAVLCGPEFKVVVPCILPGFALTFPEWWWPPHRDTMGEELEKAFVALIAPLLFVDMSTEAMRTAAPLKEQLDKLLDSWKPPHARLAPAPPMVEAKAFEALACPECDQRHFSQQQLMAWDREGIAEVYCAASQKTMPMRVLLPSQFRVIHESIACPDCVSSNRVPPALFERQVCLDERKAKRLTVVCVHGHEVLLSTLLLCELFVSYSWGKLRRTQDIVRTVKAEVEREANVCCWLDLEVMGGGQYLDKEMQAGVQGAAVVLIVLTNDYITSGNCLKEVKFATDSVKFVIPLLLCEGSGADNVYTPPSEEQWYPTEPAFEYLRHFRPLKLTSPIESSSGRAVIAEVARTLSSRLHREPRGNENRTADQAETQDSVLSGILAVKITRKAAGLVWVVVRQCKLNVRLTKTMMQCAIDELLVSSLRLEFIVNIQRPSATSFLLLASHERLLCECASPEEVQPWVDAINNERRHVLAVISPSLPSGICRFCRCKFKNTIPGYTPTERLGIPSTCGKCGLPACQKCSPSSIRNARGSIEYVVCNVCSPCVLQQNTNQTSKVCVIS